MKILPAIGALCLLVAFSGCRSKRIGPIAPPAPDSGVPRSWMEDKPQSGVPKGMAWIPGGALVAGTAPARLPRKADEEMPGQQVVLGGFAIDKFAFPNEQGAIPQTNVTFAQARALCEEAGKRLCTELEWERACKGPANGTYEYGDRYVQGTCGMGSASRILPSGYRFGCQSEFGVHDLHGSLWEWTDSHWGRGTKGKQRRTLRGGNGVQGEVIGRCANGQPADAKLSQANIGFRCCQGPRNDAEVKLHVVRGKALQRLGRVDRELAQALIARLPGKVQAALKSRGVPRAIRLWQWRPVGNEDLLVAGICAGVGRSRRCGVLLVRRTLGRLDVLDWADSGHFVPTLKLEHSARLLWVYGGDTRSHYRRAVSFEWGKLSISSEHRNARRP